MKEAPGCIGGSIYGSRDKPYSRIPGEKMCEEEWGPWGASVEVALRVGVESGCWFQPCGESKSRGKETKKAVTGAGSRPAESPGSPMFSVSTGSVVSSHLPFALSHHVSFIFETSLCEDRFFCSEKSLPYNLRPEERISQMKHNFDLQFTSSCLFYQLC